jgi:hypothetical protein
MTSESHSTFLVIGLEADLAQILSGTAKAQRERWEHEVVTRLVVLGESAAPDAHPSQRLDLKAGGRGRRGNAQGKRWKRKRNTPDFSRSFGSQVPRYYIIPQRMPVVPRYMTRTTTAVNVDLLSFHLTCTRTHEFSWHHDMFSRPVPCSARLCARIRANNAYRDSAPSTYSIDSHSLPHFIPISLRSPNV